MATAHPRSTTHPKRAAIYLRISKDREGLRLGVDRQEADCRDLAVRRGYKIVAVYCDDDKGASNRSKKRRPDYAQMCANARAGDYDVILAYSTSRLTRRPREHEDQIDLAERTGIEYEFVASPSFDLNTSAGRRIARILAASDAGEAEDTSERIERQKLQAAADGLWRGGRRPYGFDIDGVTVRPAEAAEVLRWSEAVLAGASLRGLAIEARKQGLVTSTGGPWRQETLRSVLLRARNAGLVERHGEVVATAVWPAIVPEGVWMAVKAVLGDPGRRNQWSSASRWLGSGLYKCGLCGTGMVTVAGAASRRAGVINYTCRASRHIIREQGGLDEFVCALVVGRLGRPDAVELFRRQTPTVDIAGLHTQRLAIRQQLDELPVLFTRKVFDQRQVALASQDLHLQLEELDLAIQQASRGSALAGIVGSDDVRAAWEALSVDRKRAIIRTLMVVTVQPAKRGRRPGWKAGERYFDPASIDIRWLKNDELS